MMIFMKLYNVEVIETLSRVVEQKANSYEEAEELVSARYSNEDIVLDWNDLDDTSYRPYPSQKIKESFFIGIEYDKENNTVAIGSVENDSIKDYSCKNMEDLRFALKNYLENNVSLDDVQPEKIIKKKDHER